MLDPRGWFKNRPGFRINVKSHNEYASYALALYKLDPQQKSRLLRRTSQTGRILGWFIVTETVLPDVLPSMIMRPKATSTLRYTAYCRTCLYENLDSSSRTFFSEKKCHSIKRVHGFGFSQLPDKIHSNV